MRESNRLHIGKIEKKIGQKRIGGANKVLRLGRKRNYETRILVNTNRIYDRKRSKSRVEVEELQLNR